MKKINNKINSLLVNSIIIFIYELTFSLTIFKSISILTILFIIFSSVIAGTIIKLIAGFLNHKINFIINLLLILSINILFIGQFMHYQFYNCLFSTFSMLHSGQIFAWFDYILKVILKNWLTVIVFIIPIILFIIFRKKIDFSKNNKKICLVYLLVLIGTIGLFNVTLNIDKKDNYSRYNLVHTVHSLTLSAKKLGVITSMTLDFKRYIFGFDDKILENNYFNIKEYDNTYNITNIKFDINYDDNKINSINNYLLNQKPTNKNKYTGLFKGKNLILITAESFSPIAIRKDLTPTLYKIYNNGFKFNNFYSPIYYASTTDGEYITQTSLLPKEGTWSLYESKNNYFPYTFGKIFKTNNYKAYAYHNGNYKFYERNLTHTNLGYNSFTACGNGLEEKINCNLFPTSDLEMINATFDDYKNDNSFLVYYLTMSGHLSYNFSNNDIAIKNKQYVKTLNNSDTEKAFISANIELDKAIESLINYLEKENILDDTVIVLSADHFPYGLTEEEITNLGFSGEEYNFDSQKNTLIIWNNTIKESISVDKYASSLDILPTVLNLFGINYDSRLLMGNDILGDNNGIVIFSNRSWITNNGKYNSLTNTFTPSNNRINIDKDYVNEINDIVYNKYSVSRLIYDTNYYKYILKDS